jgi:hypothetical protein
MRLPFALLGLLLVASEAHAQVSAPGFLLDRFTPATAGSAWAALESLDFGGPAVRLGYSWNEKPFVVEDQLGEPLAPIVARQMWLSLGGAITVFDRVRLGLDLPLAFYQKGRASPAIDDIVYPAPETAAFGDLRATVDLRLLGGERVRLAAGSHLFVPVQRSRYGSDGIVRVHPRLSAAGDWGSFSYAAALGFVSRDRIADEWFGGYGIGHELSGGLALAYRPAREVAFAAELFGYSKADGDFLKRRRSPAELLFSVRFHFGDVAFAFGAGPGLGPGKGVPEARYLAQLQWTPAGSPP